MNHIIKLIITGFLLFPGLCPAAGSNRYEEQIAARLGENLADGEIRRLPASGTEFVALYNEPLGRQPQGAVILLHGMGGHPDWPDVIAPLRRRFPEQGWTTLSIQLPVLSPDKPIADYGKTVEQARARIGAALQYLQQQRYLNIVIVGYSFGAALAADYLAENKDSRIKALIGISMQAQPFLNPRLNLPKRLGAINLPLLDIYGSRDFYEVTQRAAERLAAAQKGGNPGYSQRVIEGADHYYTGLEEILFRQIRGWLDKNVPEVQIEAKEQINQESETGEKARGND